MKVSDFKKSGEIHNAFLLNVKENFRILEKIDNINERIEVVNNFNKEFVSSLDLPTSEKQILVKELDNHKDLVLTSNLVSRTFKGSPLKGIKSTSEFENVNIFQLIEKLREDNQINENSHNILNSLAQDLKLNYEHSLSDLQFKENIEALIENFNNYGYDIESGEGKMVGTVLAISIASIQWWEENPDALPSHIKVAPWVAADVVGAALGAGISAAAQYHVNDEVNWEVVGYSALGAGAVASTGIVGKAAKWISGLF